MLDSAPPSAQSHALRSAPFSARRPSAALPLPATRTAPEDHGWNVASAASTCDSFDFIPGFGCGHFNDTLLNASGLGTRTADFNLTNLTIYNAFQQDFDFYSFTTDATGLPGDRIRLTTSSFFIGIFVGNVRLRLFNSSGGVIDTDDTGFTSSGSASVSLNGLPAGTYFVGVVDVSGNFITGNYELDFDVPTPPPIDLIDLLDPNNTAPNASSFGDLTADISLTSLSIHSAADVDWFHFRIPPAPTVTASTVTIRYDFSDGGPLGVAVYDANLNLIDVSQFGLGVETVIFPAGLAPGDYFIAVDGSLNHTNEYSLEVDVIEPDGRELNNSGLAATIPTTPEGRFQDGTFTESDLNMHLATDQDWFLLQMVRPGAEDHFVEADFTGEFGFDVGSPAMIVYDIFGFPVGFDADLFFTDRLKVPLHGLPAGFYFVQVFDQQGFLHDTYDLNFALPARAEGGDVLEPNDVLPDATVIANVVPQFGGRIELDQLSVHIPQDQDLFRFTLDSTATAADFVAIDSASNDGNVDLALYQDVGGGQFVPIRFSANLGNQEFISLDGLPAGDYVVQATSLLTLNLNPNDLLLTFFGDTLPEYELIVNVPVALAADRFDSGGASNDTPGTALALGAISGRNEEGGLSIHGNSDHDFFTFSTSAPGLQGHRVRIDFSHAKGDLDLEVTAPDNTVLSSTGISDAEEISLAGLPAGTYQIHVSGFGGATSPIYNLSIVAPGDDPTRKDRFDLASSNDTASEAVPVASLVTESDFQSTGPILLEDLSLHDGSDEDWFEIRTVAPATSGHFVDISFDPDQGDVELELYNAAGTQLLGASRSIGNFERISLAGQAAGTYLIRVVGFEASGIRAANERYDLLMVLPGADAIDVLGTNDTPTDALSLLRGDSGDLFSIESGDEDWYQLRLETRGTDANIIAVESLRSFGDLDLQLYAAADTVNPVRESTTALATESVSLDGLPPGDYLVRVFGHAGAASSLYKLNYFLPEVIRDTNGNLIVVSPDPFEQGTGNDTPGDAVSIVETRGPKVFEGLSIHDADDIDFFQFSIEGTGTGEHFVSLSFASDVGDLTLELFTPSDTTTPLLVSDTTGDSELISLSGVPAGTYLAKVSGETNSAYRFALSGPTIGGPDAAEGAAGNDSIAAATDLRLLRGEHIIANSDAPFSIHTTTDTDFFRFEIEAAGREGHSAEIAFDHQLGNLDLSLLDATGHVLGRSRTALNHETVSLAGLPAGTYYLQVNGAEISPGLTATNPAYALRVRAPRERDFAEAGGGNDTQSTAYDLRELIGVQMFDELSIHEGNGTQADVDWFLFELGHPGVVGDFAAIAFRHVAGDLDLYLHDAAGNVLDQSTTNEELERVSFAGLNAGEYFLRVVGHNGGSSPEYELIVNPPTEIPGDAMEGQNLTSDAADTNNDTLARATDLRRLEGFLELSGLSIHSSSDVDLFRLELGAAANASHFAAAAFDHALGDLQLRLLNASGAVVDTSSEVTNREEIRFESLAAGVYFLEVSGVGGATNPLYGLTIRAPYVPDSQGRFEADAIDRDRPNDTQAAAFDLAGLDGAAAILGGSIHQAADEDWYRFDLLLPAVPGNEARIDFQHTEGDLTLHLRGETGNLIATSATLEDFESIDFHALGLQVGTYFLQVAGVSGAVNPAYDLSITGPPKPERDFTEEVELAGSGLLSAFGHVPQQSLGPNINPRISGFVQLPPRACGNCAQPTFSPFKGPLSGGVLSLEEGFDDPNIRGFFTALGSALSSISPVMNTAPQSFGNPTGFFPDLRARFRRQTPNIAAVQGLPLAGAPIAEFMIRSQESALAGILGIDGRLNAGGGGSLNAQQGILGALGVGSLYGIPSGLLNEAFRPLPNLRGLEVAQPLFPSTPVPAPDPGPFANFTLSQINNLGSAGVGGSNPLGNLFNFAIGGSANPLQSFASSPFQGPRTGGVMGGTGLSSFLSTFLGFGALSSLTASKPAPEDEDLFDFELSEPGTVGQFVSLYFDHDSGDLDLELVDAAGVTLARSEGFGDIERISLAGLPVGAYTVSVFGQQNPDYTLAIDTLLERSPDFAEPVDASPPEDDGRGRAYDLRQVNKPTELTNLSLHESGDDDWFVFETLGTGRAADLVRISFNHAAGDLDLELFDDTGNSTPLDSSRSTGNVEEIILDGLPAGRYFVRVSGYEGAWNNNYDLLVQVAGPMIAPDALEANNELGDATELARPSFGGHLNDLSIHAGDEDLFRFSTSTTATRAHFVAVEYGGPANSLQLELLDENGGLLATGVAHGGGLSLSLEGRPAGSYFLRVQGAGPADESLYDLHLSAPLEGVAATDQWTLMFYVAAERLPATADHLVNELEQLARVLPDTVYLSLLIDGPGADGVVAGFVLPDGDADLVASMLSPSTTTSLAESAALADFIADTFAAAPSAKSALFIVGNGAGLDGIDTGDGDLLQISEIAAGIASSGQSLSVLALDAGRTASAEVVESLASAAEHLVLTQEVPGGAGLPYAMGLAALGTSHLAPPGFVSHLIAGHSATSQRESLGADVLSGIATAEVSALIAALNAFTSAVASNAATEDWDLIRDARDQATHFHASPNLRDLGQFAKAVSETAAETVIRDAASALFDTVTATVENEFAGRRETSGLSILLPAPGTAPPTGYATEFAGFVAATGWGDFLDTLISGPTNRGQAALPPDWAEANDSPARSFNLHTLVGPGHEFDDLSLHQSADVDWFRFQIAADGESGDVARIVYDAAADLQLELFSDPFQPPLQSGQSGNGSESVSLSGQPAGEYYLRVSRQTNSQPSGYTLTLDAPLTSNVPDWAAGNVDQTKGESLGVIATRSIFPGLLLDRAAGDWFSVRSPRASGVTRLSFRVRSASMDEAVRLRVFDDAQLMATAEGTGTLRVGFAPLPDRTYSVHVEPVSGGPTWGPEGGSGLPYTLEILGGEADPVVVDHHIFYGNSFFDGGDPTAGPLDDLAIAPDKQPLLPGQQATFDNYSSFDRGINGVMVDLQHLALPESITAADFEFHVGNDDTPHDWQLAPAPTGVYVRSGAGTGESDRLTILFADNAIEKQWLRITVLANARTGLTAEEVHYWGNAIGETGDDPGNAFVNAFDSAGVRDNGRTGRDPAPIDFVFDINRDQFVNAFDSALVRDHSTTGRNALRLIDLSSGSSSQADAFGQPGDGGMDGYRFDGLPVLEAAFFPGATNRSVLDAGRSALTDARRVAALHSRSVDAAVRRWSLDQTPPPTSPTASSPDASAVDAFFALRPERADLLEDCEQPLFEELLSPVEDWWPWFKRETARARR